MQGIYCSGYWFYNMYILCTATGSVVRMPMVVCGTIYSGSGRQRSDQFEPSVWPTTTILLYMWPKTTIYVAIPQRTEDNTIALGLHSKYTRIVLMMNRRDFVTLKLFAAVLMWYCQSCCVSYKLLRCPKKKCTARRIWFMNCVWYKEQSIVLQSM